MTYREAHLEAMRRMGLSKEDALEKMKCGMAMHPSDAWNRIVEPEKQEECVAWLTQTLSGKIIGTLPVYIEN